MEIIKFHEVKSKAVDSWGQIKKEALELQDFVDNGKYKGHYDKAFSIHHSQVSAEPFNYFVVAKNFVVKDFFKNAFIINPKIIEAPVELEHEVPVMDRKTGQLGKKKIKVKNNNRAPEACMSFPYRKEKNTDRHFRIKVSYQTPGLLGLKTHEDWVESILARIFQHEIGHAEGKNIFFD